MSSTDDYLPAVGPRLRRLLIALLIAFAGLTVNAVYLGGVTFHEWLNDTSYQSYFYQTMFLTHLGLGVLILVPSVVYGLIHIGNAHGRPNRRAVRAGYALFVTVLVLLASGLALTRGIPLVELRAEGARQVAYWAHVIAPLVIIWLFVLHRLAGPRIKWRVGGSIAAIALVFSLAAIGLQTRDPRNWNTRGPESGARYFLPSLAKTTTGNFIPARALMMDGYCEACHADIHAGWAVSAHRFSSFNNPAHGFSVRNTRQHLLARDGNVRGSRFCAGCHDPVPFFSGAFDDPDFDDVAHPTAHAGITCTVCHAITHINSPRGNADYTIEEPLHYPFAYSERAWLRWLNRFLIKANPAFHKNTFLKPLHQEPAFCGLCHKVHLPEAFNRYKWLRGQNHYDAYELSGVSGHGVESFYYPPKAVHKCSECHMPLTASRDFGAGEFDDSATLKIHDHQFVGANTALASLLGLPTSVNEAHRSFLEDSLRVDLFGLRREAHITGELIAPLRPTLPVIKPGERYLLEVVLRTLTLGHTFTQGTADSNEVWLELTLSSAGRVIGKSGGLDPADGNLDPWSHHVNAYVLDRDGNRIDRRNPEDIFVTLYNHQVPPGAADVIHYVFVVPDWITTSIDIEANLLYRKFDTRFTRYFQGEAFDGNDLPIIAIASDQLRLPVEGAGPVDNHALPTPVWERWNDYGIGLLRRVGTGELRQSEAAFKQVEALERTEGALNLARVYLREGRLDEAVTALTRAGADKTFLAPWSVTYFNGVVNYQNGFLDRAIADFRSVESTQFGEARRRGFDFSRDYRLLNRLGRVSLDRAKLERGEVNRERRNVWLDKALGWFTATLALDPENVAAHYGLAQTYALLGDEESSSRHSQLHAKYKVDDNARDRVITLARQKDPVADHAANDVVIYDLQRDGAFGLPPDWRQ